jgi:hypothetical protein
MPGPSCSLGLGIRGSGHTLSARMWPRRAQGAGDRLVPKPRPSAEQGTGPDPHGVGSAGRSRGVKLDAAGVRSGDKDGLDALVAQASQEAVEEGLVDRAHDLGGAAGQRVEGAVAQPQGVRTRTVGLVAVLLEQLAGGGEGPLGPQSPERSGPADVGAELLALGGGEPGGSGQWRLVGGCPGEGVDQQLSDQLVVALGDGDP